MVIEKKPIAPTLRNLMVGDTEEFPRVQYESILQSCHRMKVKLDMQFSTAIKEDCIEVTRIK